MGIYENLQLLPLKAKINITVHFWVACAGYIRTKKTISPEILSNCDD